jgi:hypothetical protein
LIGGKTMSPDVLALRARNYAKAYKMLSVKDWNSYATLGLQQFASPSKYLKVRDSETENERHLRLGRYYRLHLENHTPVDKFLMSQIAGIEIALKISFPGYFDMSVVEMNEYLHNLSHEDLADPDEEYAFSPPTDIDDSPNEADMPGAVNTDPNSMDMDDVPTETKSVPTKDPPSSLPVSPSIFSQEPMPSGLTPTTQDFTDADASSAPLLSTCTSGKSESAPVNSSAPGSTTNSRKASSEKPSKTLTTPTDPVQGLTQPVEVTHPVRIEARWAPKDFHALRASTAKMYIRLAPILSCFNNPHSWLIEWQTDQLAPTPDVSSSQLSKFMSIREVPVLAQQCFYFSFRVNATGKQLVQVLQSQVLKQTKRGENLTLDPSFIPSHQGELVNIGDILLKDASVTHRTRYLKYLRSEVLPNDTPMFDLKLRHKDPAGQKTPILTVRCGKSVAVSVAQTLSTALNGEGTNPEIFISRLALGANQVAKGEHEQIYKVHHDYLADVKFIPFTASRMIDRQVIEHLASGETVTRTPRQWAKSLTDSNGQSLEVDLEQGTSDGSAVLITPSASHSQVLVELNKYWQRQNPALATATKLYTDTVLDDPDIPMTVFTRNIETILAKKIKKSTPSVVSEEATTFLSPESSITGTTSKSSKGPIAWKVPLQETMHRHGYTNVQKQASRLATRDLAQKHRIAALEAQLASLNSANSKTSSTTEQRSHRSQSRTSQASSQLSGNSPALTIASAHARLDGIETAVQSIHTLLSTLTARVHIPAPPTDNESSTTHSSTEWPSISRNTTMTGVQLFPSDTDNRSSSSLVVLSPLRTPTKTNPSKRRKPTASPDLRLTYNGSMGSSGEGSC